MKAWHFTTSTLRNGDPIPKVGVPLAYKGKLKMCESGLHASIKIIDALVYAPGPMIHRVECAGKIVQQEDKLVCSKRTILWSLDGTQLLHRFARECALDVIHLWDAPAIVRRYLATGDESIRVAANAAADVGAVAARVATNAAFAANAAAFVANAASNAASNAARAARAVHYAAADDAAYYAARKKQNKRLEALVNATNKGD